MSSTGFSVTGFLGGTNGKQKVVLEKVVLKIRWDDSY